MKTRLDLIDVDDLQVELIRKRNERNLTQEELASRINSTKSFISQVENNRREPHFKTIVELFKSMGYKIQIAITEEK